MAEDEVDLLAGSTRLGPPSPPKPPEVGYVGDNERDLVAGSTPIGPKKITETSFKDTRTGSAWDDITHGLGVGTRNVVEGITSLPGAVADVATWPARAAINAFAPKEWRQTAPSDLVTSGLNRLGLPAAQTEEEKQRAEFIRGGAAMLSPMGIGTAAPNLVARLPAVVRPFVGTNPTTGTQAAAQTVAGGVGAGVGEFLAKDARIPDELKPTARLIGNVLGAGGTSALTGAVGTLVNAAKGVPSEIAAALARLNITPRTMGAVTDRPGVQAAEAILSRLPGSMGVLKPKQEMVVDDFGKAVQGTAGKLSPAVTEEDAGTAVQKLLRDWQGQTFKSEQDALWNPLSQRLAGASVDPATLRATLVRTAKDPALDSLPELQRTFINGKLNEWLKALDADVPPGSTMSWEQAMAVKRRIGDVMGTPDLVGSTGSQALKSVYGSLAEDMKVTANQHGQGRLFEQANKVTTDGHHFIENVVNKAVKSNNPDQETLAADQAARNLLRDNQALQLLRERVPEAADALAAHKLRQMAVAKPSSDADISTGTFLSNLRTQEQQRPEGTRALFGHPPEVAQSVEDLRAASQQLRNVERNTNSPNTAAALQMATLPVQFYEALQRGGLSEALGLVAGNFAIPYGGAKVLTNPALIKLMSAKPGAATPMRGRVAGLLGAQATGQDDIPTITVRP